MTQSFKQKIKQGKPQIGAIQTLPALEITEMMIMAGFQWLFIDMEHSALDVPAVQRIMQAAQPQCPCIVRVPFGEEVWIKRLLDAGADGLLFPQVNSAQQAEKIVKMCKYPPQGSRGVGLARAQGYGKKLQDYIETANRDTMVVMQIEHIEAVRNIESIVKVPGIDVLFIGPYDLSGSMGKIGKVNDPEVQEKIEIVRSVCVHAGVPLGIFTVDPEAVKTLTEKGYSLITLGIDVMYFSGAVQEAFDKIEN